MVKLSFTHGHLMRIGPRGFVPGGTRLYQTDVDFLQ